MRSAFVVPTPRTTALRALNYSPHVEAFRRNAAGRSALQLGDLLRAIGPAYWAVFTRLDCHPSQGVELLSQSDMFAAEPQGRVIRRDSMPVPEDHEIRRWQVLIAGAGTLGETELYGRALMADGRLAGKYVGPHAMVLDFKEPSSDLALYTYALLLTRVGIGLVRATSFGTKILGVRKDMLRELPIPEPDSWLSGRVAALIRTAVTQRERFAMELGAARAPIEALPEMQEAMAMCVDRRARCVSWQGPMPTFCAWNFASAGKALPLLRSRWPNRLRDWLTEPPFKGGRWARVTCDPPNGVELLDQRDLASIRPTPRRIARPPASEGELFAADDELLLASRGQLTDGTLFGRAFPATLAVGKMVSEDFMRLVPRRGLGEVLYAFLSSRVGHIMVKSTAFGTSIPAIRADLLSDLPVPSLDADELRVVSAAVQGASVARRTADIAETEAVRIVEEEVLPQWLA